MFHSNAFASRRGAAVVEMACVLPVFVLIVMGSIEVGRGVMVRHVLEEAARAGCRVAIMEGATPGDVTSIVQKAMTKANLSDYSVELNPPDLSSLGPFEPVTVQVSIPYSKASWFQPRFMAQASLSGICVLPAEVEGDKLPDPVSGKKNKKNKKNKK
ncbi:MAG: pilus assembly protein [Pirellulaceae bacterium]|nr:pilus assembly protein [Pirellulaceae bacterium]